MSGLRQVLPRAGRRAYEWLSAPALAVLDVLVAAVVWAVLTSSHSPFVRLVVLVPVLAVGGSSFVVRNRWWRPKPACEVRNCTNRSEGQTVATNVEDVEVYRAVCHDHWMLWRGPGVGSPEAAAMRDQLVVLWGWPGTAWARS